MQNIHKERKLETPLCNNNEFLAEKMWKENKLKHNCKHLKNNFLLYSIPVLMIYIPYWNGTKALSQTNTNTHTHTHIHSNMQAAASFSFTTTLKLNVIKTRHSNYMKFIQIKYHWYKYGMLQAFASFDNILAIRSDTWTDLHLNVKRFIEKKRCFSVTKNKSKKFWKCSLNRLWMNPLENRYVLETLHWKFLRYIWFWFQCFREFNFVGVYSTYNPTIHNF